MTSDKQNFDRPTEDNAEKRGEKIRAHVKQMLQKVAVNHTGGRRNDLSRDQAKPNEP